MIAQAFPASFAGGLTQFLHANALGSDAQITNQTGAVAYDILYYPWGQYWTHAGRQGDTHFAGFQQSGAIPDAYPTPTRRYGDNLGRWLTPDPAGKSAVRLDDPQSWNMYAYVLDSPTTNTDPTGKACILGFTIFGSHFGGRCASDSPPQPPLPPGPPQGGPLTPTYNLVHAQDQARGNPAFQPTPRSSTEGRKTYCNLATCSIASQTGVPTGPLTNGEGVPLLANQQAANLLQSGQYHQVSPGEAQALADQGVTVFAVQPRAGHGHIATVRPDNTYFAPYEITRPGGTGPTINNIGGFVGIVHQSRAFYNSPAVTYIAPNNPNQ